MQALDELHDLLRRLCTRRFPDPVRADAAGRPRIVLPRLDFDAYVRLAVDEIRHDGRGSIQVAISTGGKSPALARTLKEDLQRVIGPEYDEINQVLGTLRKAAKQVLPTDVDRKKFFDAIIAEGVIDMVRDGKRREAYETIARACENAGIKVSDRVRQVLGKSS